MIRSYYCWPLSNDLILQPASDFIRSTWLYNSSISKEGFCQNSNEHCWFLLFYIIWSSVSLRKQSYHFWLKLSTLLGFVLLLQNCFTFFFPLPLYSPFIYQKFLDNGLRRVIDHKPCYLSFSICGSIRFLNNDD